MVPLFGAAYAAPNRGTTILYLFRPPKTELIPLANFSSPLSVIQVLFKANFIFNDFQDSPVYSSSFQACANPVCPLSCLRKGRGQKIRGAITILILEFDDKKK